MVLLEVRTGCRLHFGLMELCPSAPWCYGGLGIMLDSPGFRLRLSGRHGERAEINGGTPEVSQRIQSVLRRRQELVPGARVPEFIAVESELPLHSGLGSGTQLASAIAAGADVFTRENQDATWTSGDWYEFSVAFPEMPDQWLLEHSGRGARSAVGLKGFFSAGLVMDYGNRPDEDFATRTQVLNLPEPWRVITLCPELDELTSGEKEHTLLSKIGRQTNPHSQRMYALAEKALHLATKAVNFDPFTSCLEEYMEWAGRVFLEHQGGMYNGEKVASAVELARAVGLQGVGQSSWGPTVFGFTKNQAKAEEAVRELKSRGSSSPIAINISTPATKGAEFRFVDTQSC